MDAATYMREHEEEVRSMVAECYGYSLDSRGAYKYAVWLENGEMKYLEMTGSNHGYLAPHTTTDEVVLLVNDIGITENEYAIAYGSEEMDAEERKEAIEWFINNELDRIYKEALACAEPFDSDDDDAGDNE